MQIIDFSYRVPKTELAQVAKLFFTQIGTLLPTTLNHISTRVWRILSTSLVLLALSGCGTSNLGNVFDSGPTTPDSTISSQDVPATAPSSTKSIKIGLLLPLGAGGEVGRIGTAMKNAAEMALIDHRGTSINFITKDTRGNAQTAANAARAAINEGAEIIIGPLLSTEVTAVSSVARSKKIPVIAFSSVSSVAGNGTYLMSFLPEQEINNVVRYAASTGVRNIAALLPKSQYGATIERALISTARTYRVNASIIKRFPRNSQAITIPVQQLAVAMRKSGTNPTLLIAEGGALLRNLGTVLAQNGITAQTQRVIGTGLWDDVTTAQAPIAVNGWYAGVSPALVKRFDQRYRTAYGTKPSRLASLSYDAVSMSAALSKASKGKRFTARRITNRDGFQGMNGLFRFTSNGLIQRGLSILQVTPNGATVLAPARTKF